MFIKISKEGILCYLCICGITFLLPEIQFFSQENILKNNLKNLLLLA
jgi:hypothetical protein